MLSPRPLQDVLKRCPQDIFKTCLQDVFKTSSRHAFRKSSSHVFKTSWRRLQRNNFSSSKTSCEISSRRLQDVLEDETLSRWRCVEDVFKKCLQDVFKTCWRPTNACWETLKLNFYWVKICKQSYFAIFCWNNKAGSSKQNSESKN